jgi:hypothetical protein
LPTYNQSEFLGALRLSSKAAEDDGFHIHLAIALTKRPENVLSLFSWCPGMAVIANGEYTISQFKLFILFAIF